MTKRTTKNTIFGTIVFLLFFFFLNWLANFAYVHGYTLPRNNQRILQDTSYVFKHSIPLKTPLTGKYGVLESKSLGPGEEIKLLETGSIYDHQKNILSLKKQAQINSSATIKDKIIYSARYTINQFSRREDGQTKRDKHILIMGCSFAFGIGVNDNETISRFLDGVTQNYTSYNLGLPGGNATDTYANFKVSEFTDGIKQKNGLAVYIYISSHLQRAFSTSEISNTFDGMNTFLEIPQNGEIKILGSYKSVHPVGLWIKKIFTDLPLVKFLGISFPFINQQRLVDFVRIVAGIKETYRVKFWEKNRFVFIFYPGSITDNDVVLKKLLDEAGIETLDLSDLDISSHINDKDAYDYDSHPTPGANQFIAKVIANELELY